MVASGGLGTCCLPFAPSALACPTRSVPFAFERFVTLRYLRGAEGRAEGRSFLRFIIAAAVGGVALGVAALLLALAIVRGFSSTIEEKIIGFGAHVQVENSYQDTPLAGAGALADRLRRFPQVTSVAPVVQDFALLRRSAGEIDGVALWGTLEPPPYLRRQMAEGAFSFAPDTAGRPGIVLGQTLARRLGISVGDVVTVFSIPADGERGQGAALTQPPRVKQFHVAGLFETALNDFDDLYAFVDIAIARSLLGFAPDEVSRLDLTLHDAHEADSVAAAVEEEFGFPVRAATIFQIFSGLFAWVNLQQSITPLVISVIVVVAAFNIIGTLLMLLLEKTREIGVMVSLGASQRAVRRLFLGLGLGIGAAGTLAGEALALVLGLVQMRYKLIPLPAEAYYMTSAPVELRLFDFVFVGAVALALCVVAAYVPARVAARIEPVRAIRFQ